MHCELMSHWAGLLPSRSNKSTKIHVRGITAKAEGLHDLPEWTARNWKAPTGISLMQFAFIVAMRGDEYKTILNVESL